jgi:hypothetical protein
MQWRWIAAVGLVVSLALFGYAYAQEEVVLPEPLEEPVEVQPEQPQFMVDPTAEIEQGTTFEGDAKLNQPIIDLALQPLIDLAQQDLMNRLGPTLAAAQPIEVIEARAVVWSDGGLGCPRPDMAYIQVMTDGTLIRLRAADGTVYQYHSGGRRLPFLCENPDPLRIPPAEPAAPGDTPLPPPGFGV